MQNWKYTEFQLRIWPNPTNLPNVETVFIVCAWNLRNIAESKWNPINHRHHTLSQHRWPHVWLKIIAQSFSSHRRWKFKRCQLRITNSRFQKCLLSKCQFAVAHDNLVCAGEKDLKLTMFFFSLKQITTSPMEVASRRSIDSIQADFT